MQSDHGVRGPQKTDFKALHYPLTWSNGVWGGRGKRGALIKKRQGPTSKKCCYNKFAIIFLLGEEKMKTRECWNLIIYLFIYFQNWCFGHILKKNYYIQFLMHGHSSLSTFGLHLEGLKGFENGFSPKRDQTMEKGHLPCSMVYKPEPYIGCPYPCPCPPIPMSFGWAWVRCYYSWVGMGGHRFCASLHRAPNQSQTSRMQGIC
jgi:hypothetical protein